MIFLHNRSIQQDEQNPGKLFFSRYFKINTIEVLPPRYQELRSAFGKIVDADGEQIVIRKTN